LSRQKVPPVLCNLEYCRITPIRNPASNSRNQRTSLGRIDPFPPLFFSTLLKSHNASGPRSIPGWPCGLNLLERRLVESRATVVIPLYERVFFIRLLNCTEFSSRLSEISQPLDAITGIQFRVGSRGLDERWPLGSVCVSRCSNVRQRRLRSFAQFWCQFIDAAHIPFPRWLCFACLSSLYVKHALGKDGSADPNCTVLTTNLADLTDCRRRQCGSLGFRRRS
jgi:hypothetical protein